jgi:hypothetical protein
MPLPDGLLVDGTHVLVAPVEEGLHEVATDEAACTRDHDEFLFVQRLHHVSFVVAQTRPGSNGTSRMISVAGE